MIRKYQPADCEDVLNVWARASALAHPFLSKDFLELERHNIANVHLPKADTWAWEADGHVVGFISLLGNEVGAIFVDPEFHRSGSGGGSAGPKQVSGLRSPDRQRPAHRLTSLPKLDWNGR